LPAHGDLNRQLYAQRVAPRQGKASWKSEAERRKSNRVLRR
jgi:hypothetical protein